MNTRRLIAGCGLLAVLGGSAASAAAGSTAHRRARRGDAARSVARGRPARASAAISAPAARTFSFIGRAGAHATTVVNSDSLLINARCDARGNPVIFAFTSSPGADLFARVFDGQGRTHMIKDTAFTSHSRGVLLSPGPGYDSMGTALFETGTGQVVSINYAFDNSTTLNHQDVCTAFGSYTAS